MKENTITIGRNDYDKFKLMQQKYGLLNAKTPFFELSQHLSRSLYSSYYINDITLIDGGDEVIKLLKETIIDATKQNDKLSTEADELRDKNKELYRKNNKLEEKIKDFEYANKKKSWFK